MDDKALQRYIHRQILGALGQRSWYWLSQQTRVPPGTLGTQKKRLKYTLETVARVARVLGRPIAYFLPPEEEFLQVEEISDEVAVLAFREFERIYLTARAMPADAAGLGTAVADAARLIPSDRDEDEGASRGRTG